MEDVRCTLHGVYFGPTYGVLYEVLYEVYINLSCSAIKTFTFTFAFLDWKIMH